MDGKQIRMKLLNLRILNKGLKVQITIQDRKNPDCNSILNQQIEVGNINQMGIMFQPLRLCQVIQALPIQ